MVPSTEHTWPQFEDGDVEICLSKDPADRFVLHSVVLALHIPVLKVSLSERWSIGERHTADRNAGPIKWKYHLLFEKDQDSGMLMRVPAAHISSKSTPELEMVDRILSYQESKDNPRNPCAIMHRELLRVLYHHPLSRDNIEHTVPNAAIISLIGIADMYQCPSLVKNPIENFLALFKTPSAATLKACTQTPRPMLEFAIATKCQWLFDQIMGHLLCGTLASMSTAPTFSPLWTAFFEQNPSMKIVIRQKWEELSNNLRGMVLAIISDLGSPVINGAYWVAKSCILHKLSTSLAEARTIQDLMRIIRLVASRDLKAFNDRSIERAVVKLNLPMDPTYTRRYGEYLMRIAENARVAITNPMGICTDFLPSRGTVGEPIFAFQITDQDRPWFTGDGRG